MKVMVQSLCFSENAARLIADQRALPPITFNGNRTP
jgi:hypothetical protein